LEAAIHEFVYGVRDPETRDDFLVVTRAAVERWIAAVRSRTWGEYVQHCGLIWEDLVRDERLEEGITPETAFAIRDVWDDDYRWGWNTPPDEQAYEELLSAVPWEVLDDPELDAFVDWYHGTSPGFPLRTLSITEEGARLLRKRLRDFGYTDIVFVRDDDLLQRLRAVELKLG